MERQGIYIYGILSSSANLQLSISKEILLEEGESNKVYTITHQGISALVRDSEIADYTRMPKDVLARLLIGHQTVIERIMMAQNTIIPMRLGTFAIDETEVKDILSKGYGLIKEIISKISDKIEIDIAAVWSDFPAVIKDAGQIKEIKEFKEELLKSSKGITVDEQMRIGFMLKKALDEKREKAGLKIQDILKTIGKSYKQHELMDDKMVANIAFLADKNREKEFDAKVEELNIEFKEALNFRCVGPLPPYSFYTLEIKKLKFEEIDWAKKRLGILDGITNKDELKKAFRTRALSVHPDKNPDNSHAAKEFNDVNKAYKIITDYCAAIEQANPVKDEKPLKGTSQQNKILFEEEMSKENAMFVRVRE